MVPNKAASKTRRVKGLPKKYHNSGPKDLRQCTAYLNMTQICRPSGDSLGSRDVAEDSAVLSDRIPATPGGAKPFRSVAILTVWIKMNE